MKTIAVVWMIFLVRLCHCGDDKGEASGVDSAEPSPAKASGNENTEKCVRYSLTLSEGSTQEDYTPSFTLDITDPYQDSTFCRYHRCNYDGNDIVFIVPNNDISLEKVTYGKGRAWTPHPDEKFDYVKLFLKGGEAYLISIVSKTTTGPSCKWFARRGDVWEGCGRTFREEVDNLKVPVTREMGFVLNIEEDKDTKECAIFDARLLMSNMRLFFSKPGYFATEIRDGDKLMWKRDENSNAICLSCDLHYKKGGPSISVITFVEGGEMKYGYFEKKDGEWRPITSERFDKKVEQARNTRRGSISTFGSISGQNALKNLRSGIRSGWNDLTSKLSSKGTMTMYVERLRKLKTSSGSAGEADAGEQNTENDACASAQDFTEQNKRSSKYGDFEAPESPQSPSTDSSVEKDTRPKERPMGKPAPIAKPKRNPRNIKKSKSLRNSDEVFTFSTFCIDISIQNEAIYNSFYYHCEGVQTVFVLPREGIKVTRIVNAEEEVWMAKPGEILEYAKLYLNELCKHEFTFVASSVSNTLNKRNYERKDDRWEEMPDLCLEKMKSITEDNTAEQITIDIEDENDTDQCTIFETSLLHVSFRSYIPKDSYCATEVVHGQTTLWKAESSNDKCQLSTAYLKEGSLSLLVITINNAQEKTQRYFEKDENGWKSIDKETFDKKRDELTQYEKTIAKSL
ncbi:hypothetical protein BEWA_035210 [Theileria equi strain WA]|uniref:Signal peptide containing protein n=1 Tax=Theileria equi strain WA TaxID=1537102 RepID=L1LE09_THEEQ|nr:hypothetical protein BEWA_035210 [Theileria equi strain WA]EKX73485.1 hypothetical protein BEWA_035210 [Theileria equi strain WA]|eukprot:XP_004832937.1 hypothetical protein BEWA_035210 [Theileria equi strain WA]